MHGYLRMVIALCLLTGSLLATKPVAQAQSNALKQGKMKVIGRYPKKKLKEGKRSFRYHVLEEGNKFRMRVGGPTAVILLVRGFGRNQVTFELNMDGEKEDQVRLQVVKRPKSIYFRVPEGTHEMMVVPSAKVMVRPIPKRRKPRKGEKVVKWKEVIEVASVPLVAPK